MVKLFKYPCVVEKAQFNEYCGHSSHVTKVRFTANDRFVISTGGNDMTVMVWETDVGGATEEPINEPENTDLNEDDFEGEIFVDRARQQRETVKALRRQNDSVNLKKMQDHGEFMEEDMGEGDEALAVLPWKGQIKPPSGFKRPSKNQSDPPNIELQLEWVHGYKGNCAKNNLCMTNNGLAYNIAGLGVVYDPNLHTQAFFQHHTDDVTAIAFHPNGSLVATGENGKKPVAYIWNTETRQVLHRL